MRVMLANNTGIQAGYLAGKYPDKIGHLFSPGSQRGPYTFCRFGLDNGAFGNKGFQFDEWVKLLEWAKLSGQESAMGSSPRCSWGSRWDYCALAGALSIRGQVWMATCLRRSRRHDSERCSRPCRGCFCWWFYILEVEHGSAMV